jgi:hypothetical protein
MRMLLNVHIPNEPFNHYVRDGTVGRFVEAILAESQPEAVYFTEQNGMRAAVLIVDGAEPSDVPALTEPWFLTFNATCEIRIVMRPEDLELADLAQLGAKWK